MADELWADEFNANWGQPRKILVLEIRLRAGLLTVRFKVAAFGHLFRQLILRMRATSLTALCQVRKGGALCPRNHSLPARVSPG
jgi:hypothetical protein